MTAEPMRREQLEALALDLVSDAAIGVTGEDEMEPEDRAALYSIFFGKFCCFIHAAEKAAVEVEREAQSTLKDAVEELLTVAMLRGDNDLPSPPDDPGLWTARMQEAWYELERVFTDVGGEIDLEPDRKIEREARGW